MSLVFSKKLFSKILPGTFLVFSFFLVAPQAYAATASISQADCGGGTLELTGLGEPVTYTLSENMTCNFSVTADGVTIDGGDNGQGGHFKITGNVTGADGVNGTTDENGNGTNATGGIGITLSNIQVTGTVLSGAGGVGGFNGGGDNTYGGSGGNSGSINITNSITGDVRSARGGMGGPGNSLPDGGSGSSGSISIVNSTTGSITTGPAGGDLGAGADPGSSGSITIEGDNVNLNNISITISVPGCSAFDPSGTCHYFSSIGSLSITHTGTLTTTNTTLSALSDLIVNTNHYGAYAGGAFPLIPGDINSCGTVAYSGLYTLASNINTSGTCFTILTDDVTISGSSTRHFTVTGNGTGYAVNARGTSASLNGHSVIIQDITFNGFENGVSTTGADSDIYQSGGGVSAGNGGSITIASSTIGSVNSSGGNGGSDYNGNGIAMDSGGSAGTVSITNSNVSAIVSDGGNGGSDDYGMWAYGPGNGGLAGVVSVISSILSSIESKGGNGGSGMYVEGFGLGGNGRSVSLVNSTFQSVLASGGNGGEMGDGDGNLVSANPSSPGEITITASDLNIAGKEIRTEKAGVLYLNYSSSLTANSTTIHGHFSDVVFQQEGQSAVHSGEVLSTDVFDGARIVAMPRSLYYNNNGNTGSWATLGNWWNDLGGNTAAEVLPRNGDTAYIEAYLVDDTLETPPLLDKVIVGQNTAGVSPVFSGTILTTNGYFFKGSSVNYNGTTTGTTTFSGTSANKATVNGNAIFRDTSKNGKKVTGNATFYDSSQNVFSGVAKGSVTGTCDFYDSATLFNRVTPSQTGTCGSVRYHKPFYFNNILSDGNWNSVGNWWFNSTGTQQALNDLGQRTIPKDGDVVHILGNVTVAPTAPVHINKMYVDGSWTLSFVKPGDMTVDSTEFTGTASNNTTVYSNVTFSGTNQNNGIVVGDVTSSGTTTNNGTFDGGLTNNGLLSGDGTTTGTTTNNGTISGGTFLNTVTNVSGSITGAVKNFFTMLFTGRSKLAGSGSISQDAAMYDVSGNGGSIGGDAIFGDSSTNVLKDGGNSSLLVHFDGVNSSTAFEDWSNNHFPVNTQGSVHIDTSKYKFGGGSGYFAGTSAGDRLYVNSANNLNLGSNDFTIDAWVYPTQLDSHGRYVVSKVVTSDYSLGQGPDEDYSNDEHLSYALAVSSSGITFRYAPSAEMDGNGGYFGTTIKFNQQAPALNTWNHIAVTRSGNTLYAFINGQLVGSQDFDVEIPASESPVSIGTYGYMSYVASHTENAFVGYVDELRIVNGTALWTDSFPVPTTSDDVIIAGTVHGNATFLGDLAENTYNGISGVVEGVKLRWYTATQRQTNLLRDFTDSAWGIVADNTIVKLLYRNLINIFGNESDTNPTVLVEENNGVILRPLATSTPVTTCGVLDVENATYTLGADITNYNYDTCFIVRADGITLDGANHKVDAVSSSTSLYAVLATTTSTDNRTNAFTNLSIKNITFSDFAYAVNANGANDTNGNGGNGGIVNIATSTLGAGILANGGVGSVNGGTGGSISIVYTDARGTTASTTLSANGGDSSSCGNGGTAGTVTTTDSGYDNVSINPGVGSKVGCPSSDTAGNTGSTGTGHHSSGGNSTPTERQAASTAAAEASARANEAARLAALAGSKNNSGVARASSIPQQAQGLQNIFTVLPNVAKVDKIKLQELPTFSATTTKKSFSLGTGIDILLFAPLPEGVTKLFKTYPKLQVYLNSLGVKSLSDLVALKKSPIILVNTNDVPGLYTVTTPGIPTKLPGQDVSITTEALVTPRLTFVGTSTFAETVTMYPQTKITVTVTPATKGKLTALFNGQPLGFVNNKTSFITPTKPGLYTLTTSASPLPLLIQVKAQEVVVKKKEKVVPKEESWWSKTLSLFSF